jgi:HK97 family phage portal protein
LKNVTAFASINEIAMNVSSVPWKQFRRRSDGKREVVTDTAIAEVLKRPNPSESLEFVMLMTTAYLAMSGNAFFERVRPDTGPNKKEVRELYTKRPDRFKLKINPHSGRLEKYIYTIQGQSEVEWWVDPITEQADILHLKSFHPLDDWWGAAPTESAAREIDTSNAATQWNMGLLQNQGRPGMIYTLIGNLGEEAFDDLERYIREEKAGPTNVGKSMIITGEKGTKAEPYGWSPTDMDFGEGDLRLMRKIAMAYRVPPELLGIQDATFANRAEARLFLWENTILYYLNYLRGELNNWLFDRDDDFFIDYILDEIPALAIKRDAIWKRAQESDFLTLDEKREMVGKDKYMPSEDPGSMIFIEASKIPIGVAAIVEEEEEEEEEEVVKSLQDQGYSEDEIDEFLGYKETKDLDLKKLKILPEETKDLDLKKLKILIRRNLGSINNNNNNNTIINNCNRFIESDNNNLKEKEFDPPEEKPFPNEHA